MDEPIFECKASYDYETFRDYFRFVIIKNRLSYNLWAWLVSPVLLTFVLMLINFNQATVILFICSSTVLVLIHYLYYALPKQAYQKSKIILPDEIIYRFFPDQLEIISIGGNAEGTTMYKYAGFSKILNVKTAYYLTLANNAAIIIPKHCLEDWQINYLNDFLSERFNKLYKKYK